MYSKINADCAIKPIKGSWFSIYWYDRRHYYWNDACIHYTDDQWNALIKDMADLGMEYLVMCNVASNGYAVYDSTVLPKYPMASSDPLEAVMKACDQYGIKVFLNNDYYLAKNYFSIRAMFTPESLRGRYTMLEEVAEKYSGHSSFYGWYWAWESHLDPYFPEHFMKYINDSTQRARTLTPGAKFLTAPYGTRLATNDATFVRQVDQLDVDIIAYQDTIGCYAMDIEQSARSFETLRKVHDQVPQRKLWADVETFTWEGKDNVAETPLIPAEFSRLKAQLAAVSPYVDEILVFIFEGLFSNPNSIAYTGYEKAADYYNQYVAWLKENHPGMMADPALASLSQPIAMSAANR